MERVEDALGRDVERRDARELEARYSSVTSKPTGFMPG
jgi:hypothetical protein